MSQGESLWHVVIFESGREDFSHAILGQANANLEILHVTWVFCAIGSAAVIGMDTPITHVCSARE